MATYTGTPNNDTIDAAAVAGPSDWIDALGGDDTVKLGPGQVFVSGPGNDTVSGTGGRGGYGLWYAKERATVDLAQGYALDGFGGRDTLSGIHSVHMTSLGGAMTGSGADEQLFLFGGSNTVDMGGGKDEVRYHEKMSTDYTIRVAGGALEVRHTASGSVDTLKGVETLVFADKTIGADFFFSSTRATFQYLAHSFRETTIAPSYTYAGVTYPAGLLSWFPQAVFQLDVDGDGRKDVIAPMNKGYASGMDARTPFVALTVVDGKLAFDPAVNAQMPVTPGARRADTIMLAADGKEGIVTSAHDAHDGKLGDMYLLRPEGGKVDASAYLPTLPLALSGRPHATDAHSMATGDLNGDGREDILLGDWNKEGGYALLQQANGSFTLERSAVYTALTNQWPMLNPNAGEKHNILVDLSIVDVNNDGYGDIVAGWGHGSTHSYVFMNRGGKFSLDDKIALPDSVYGVDNQQHMKTLAADFDRDGDIDMAVLRLRYEPYYGGQYLQMLRNDGGTFTDITVANIDKPMQDAYGARLEWTDFWQVLDVNGDGALDIVGHRVVGSSAPMIYVNDGAGRFTVVELALDAAEGRPISWGDFDGDGKLEYVTFGSGWVDAAGTASENRYAVFELENAAGTGPGLQTTPGFNEGYYLNQNADVRALVASGQYASGLAHYVTKGQAEGRLAIAAGVTVQGGEGGDTITLREGNETAYGRGGNDRLDGRAGNDLLSGGAGNDILDGGSGLDRALYAGKRADFTVLGTATGFSVTDKSGAEGVDTLTDVERLQFADGAVALDIAGTAGQTYRLYQAAFGRVPDIDGLSFWIRLADGGMSMAAIALAFTQTPEFAKMYANATTNGAIVDLFYENVLHRDGEEAGFKWWTGLLDNKSLSVSEVLGAFAESPENQAALVGATQNGIDYQF